ncbi:hypothetical protein DdX_18448 [Ditylenchus destructor]|uniref:Uncharacterized protein n=1 Tax=Ditylenchus destructor TaxID=166010 RepID=A0AAD4MMA4_9BILA|nr:hypothetical protein DdX_18448 [Ditylenchus destructor]
MLKAQRAVLHYVDKPTTVFSTHISCSIYLLRTPYLAATREAQKWPPKSNVYHVTLLRSQCASVCPSLPGLSFQPLPLLISGQTIVLLFWLDAAWAGLLLDRASDLVFLSQVPEALILIPALRELGNDSRLQTFNNGKYRSEGRKKATTSLQQCFIDSISSNCGFVDRCVNSNHFWEPWQKARNSLMLLYSRTTLTPEQQLLEGRRPEIVSCCSTPEQLHHAVSPFVYSIMQDENGVWLLDPNGLEAPIFVAVNLNLAT